MPDINVSIINEKSFDVTIEKVDGGADNTKVLKAGDTMTGSLELASTDAGGYTTSDSTSRLVTESWQKAEYKAGDGGHYAEQYRLIWRDDLAKAVIAFQDGVGANFAIPKSQAWLVVHKLANGVQPYASFATFPATVFGASTTPTQADYYYLDTGTFTFYKWTRASTTNNFTVGVGSWVIPTPEEIRGNAIHQHFSVETSDATLQDIYTRFAIEYGRDVPLISFVNSHYRFFSGTFKGQVYGNLIIDSPIFSSGEYQIFPSASAVINDYDNLRTNATNGLGIRYESVTLPNAGSPTTEVIMRAFGSNRLFLDDGLITSGDVGMGIVPNGFRLDVARDGGSGAGEKFISRFSRNGGAGLNLGYIADASGVPLSGLVRASNSLSLVLGTTGANTAITIANDGTVTLTNKQIKNVLNPTLAQDVSTKDYVDTGLATKQATLISGTNIKTINSTSLLGSGNIVISSISRSINSISTNTTLASGLSTDYIYLVSGTTIATLPTAVGNTNKYEIKNSGVNTVTIDTTSSQTIDGSLTASLTPNTSLTLISNNSNWFII